MKSAYTINPNFNGIEITFDGKPAEATREALKAHGFRWHRQKALWYSKNTPERLTFAESLTTGEAIPAGEAEAKPAPVNKFGIKVGDVFQASWGYEQTNNDFFQVVELVGSCSVRVVEVYPPIVESSAVSGMSEYRTYSISRDPMPRADRPVFIKDQERGDLKRLKSWAADGVSNPCFKLSSFCDAYYCTPGSLEAYESWYY